MLALNKQKDRIEKAIILTAYSTIPHKAALHNQLAEWQTKNMRDEILTQTELDQLDSIEERLARNLNNTANDKKNTFQQNQTEQKQKTQLAVVDFDFTEEITEADSHQNSISQAGLLAPEQEIKSLVVALDFIDLTLQEDSSLQPEYSEKKQNAIGNPIIEKPSQHKNPTLKIHTLEKACNAINNTELKAFALIIYNELEELVTATKQASDSSTKTKFNKTQDLLSKTRVFFNMLAASGHAQTMNAAVENYENYLNNVLATSTWDKFVPATKNILHSVESIKTLPAYTLENSICSIAEPLQKKSKLSDFKQGIFNQPSTGMDLDFTAPYLSAASVEEMEDPDLQEAINRSLFEK